MRLDNKTKRLHNSIKYKAYTSLLEGKISQKEYDLISEIGIFDKIKSFFGGGVDVSKDLGKLFSNKVAQRQLGVAKDAITKAVKDLKDIANKAGVDEDAVNEFLMGVFKGADVDPAAVAAAGSGGGGDEGSAAAGKASAGTPVTAASVEKNPAAVAKIVADVTGKDEEKVAAELEKKQPDAASLSAVLGNAIGKNIGVDGKIVTNVVKVLISKGHLKLEGGRPLTRPGFINFINEVKTVNEHRELMGRWLQLAGLSESLLIEREADADKFKDLMDNIESGEVKTVDDLKTLMAGLKDSGGKAGLSKAMKKQIMSAFQKKNPKEDKKALEKAVQEIPVAKEEPAGDSSKTMVSQGIEPGAGDDKGNNKEKVEDLASSLKVKETEIEKHRAEAEKLAAKLKKNDDVFQGFRDRLAKSLGMTYEEFTKTMSDVGLENLVAAAIAKKPAEVEKAADAVGVDDSSQPATRREGGAGESAAGAKPTEQVKKEYGPAFKDVRSSIKPEEADDDTLAKIIDAIDSYKSVQIAA